MTATIPLSLIEGVFVLRNDRVIGVFTDLKSLATTLKGEAYKAAPALEIDIAALDDVDVETVTHLVARELIGDCTDYEAWQSVHGRTFPWLDFWFDELPTFRADIDRRVKRHKEIHGTYA